MIDASVISVGSSSGASRNIKSHEMIEVPAGSASVSNGDLFLSQISENNYVSGGSLSKTTYFKCDYTIPYHAIVGIKIATEVAAP